MTSRTRENSSSRAQPRTGSARSPIEGQKPERGRSQGRGARHERSAAQRALILDGSPSGGYDGQNHLQRGDPLYCVPRPTVAIGPHGDHLLDRYLTSGALAHSPTLSEMATRPGILLGTAEYMSPEQAKAKPVDRRADIWAFGCVLYEMLTCKRAFAGESMSETLAAVIKEEPDWSELPTNTPIRVRVLLQRCLQKDPKQRLRDIGDARISLDEVLSGAPDPGRVAPVQATAPLWRRWLLSVISALLFLATVLLAFLYFHQKPITAQAMRFEISLPERTTGSGISVISPDGSKLVLVATGTDGVARLWIRSLDRLAAQALEGTEGVYGYPFWSPHSRFIAFFAQGKLKKNGRSRRPSAKPL
jgi:serine/threonine protein kinase